MLPKKINQYVVKSNALVEARYHLTLQETRVVFWLIHQICPDDEDFKPHKIGITEFASMIGVKAENQYKELRNVTKRLMQRAMEIYEPEKKEHIQVSWLSSARYQHTKGCVILKFDPELKPYLLQLKSHFTKLDVGSVLRLRSIYSIRIFELLKQYETIGKRELSINELRSYCGIKEGEYRNYNAIKLYVLERASTEINAKTDYEVEYREIKESRKIVALEWTIKKKTHFEKMQIEKSAIIQKELRSEGAIIDKLMEYGFTTPQAKKIIKLDSQETVANALKAVDLQISRGKVKNPQAMLRTAIKERWHPERFMKRAS